MGEINSLTVTEQHKNHYEQRFTSLESRISDIATNLAVKDKIQSRKLSWLRPVTVLLSPRNPYDEFHKLFKGLPKEEFPINDYSCALSRDILLHGRLFASENWLCFYSNIFGFETVVKLECKKIKSIARAKTAYMFPNAILVRTEKKKYLFCSFLTRDSAHKLLSTIWQQSVKNNKTDSGVDENANGDADEVVGVSDADEGVEETSFDCNQDEEEELVINENDMTIIEEQLHTSKETPRVPKHHLRTTTSCPNTPLAAHHPSLQEAITTQHNEHTCHEKQNRRKISRLRKLFNVMIKLILMLLNTIYSIVSSLSWLFKRNYCIMDFVFLFATLLLFFLLSTTLTLMTRISKLEQRFHDTKSVHDYDQITDQVSSEHLGNILKDHETQFILKTERLNQALRGILLAVENVKTKLNVIKNELTLPNEQSIKMLSDT